ncbi:disease resistance protein RPV1-like [Rhododendron vialii]|uniref:disease resistance protein RPV1-like n=1 Tax=Rhododendron vialii TaxID=182163 RepID=UPI00265EF4C8|nr:disease resistance protein RPV1-like [Rhododendron vialii]
MWTHLKLGSRLGVSEKRLLIMKNNSFQQQMEGKGFDGKRGEVESRSQGSCKIKRDEHKLLVTKWATDAGIGVFAGIGGIGKTTIAKTVYNSNFDRFECSSFLLDIRETSKQPNGLVHLQEQLLSDISRCGKLKIGSVDEGMIKIKNAVSYRRVLVVLDNVDQLDHLNAVLGMRDWFCPGSKVIITKRYEKLLKPYKVDETFKVKEIDYNESLRLFSWHAFRQAHPIECFMEYSKSVLQQCKGLPHALKLLGSSLRDRSAQEWETSLEEMESFTGNQIL